MEARIRIQNRAILLQAARGAALLIVTQAKAAPRVALGAVLVALVAGIGGNALLIQAGRRPAPLSAPATQKSAAAVAPVAPHAPPPAGTGSAPGAAPQAPATTASIGPAEQADRPLSPTPSPTAGSKRVERRPAQRQPDAIGAFLRGVSVDGESQLVRSAQVALAKLGYPVKPAGAEDDATRRALRHFQRAHGLPETAEISPELVRKLSDAARTQR